MIGYIRGELMELGESRLLLAVGAGTGAVGYTVAVPHSAEYGLLVRGKVIELHIHTVVREDALDLYGFLSQEEKDLFLTLTTVSGVGPKSALHIMSGGTVIEIVRAIIDRDKDHLTAVPGIGKKTAERLVVELADTLKKRVDEGAFRVLKTVPKIGSGATDARKGPKPLLFSDARDALVGLGYRDQEVTSVLERVMEGEQAPKRVEDLVRTALRHLSL